MHSNTLIILTALVGAVTGPAAFVLSLLNYFRDKPKVIVSLEWDRCLIGGVNEDKKFGVVTVANVGRRPIFISHAHLRFPGSTVLGLLTDGLEGAKLLEGDPPKNYLMDQATSPTLGKCAAEWWKVRACVQDHTGKSWFSSLVRRKPEWGKGPVPTQWQWCLYRVITEVPIVRSIHVRSIIRKGEHHSANNVR